MRLKNLLPNTQVYLSVYATNCSIMTNFIYIMSCAVIFICHFLPCEMCPESKIRFEKKLVQAFIRGEGKQLFYVLFFMKSYHQWRQPLLKKNLLLRHHFQKWQSLQNSFWYLQKFIKKNFLIMHNLFSQIC